MVPLRPLLGAALAAGLLLAGCASDLQPAQQSTTPTASPTPAGSTAPTSSTGTESPTTTEPSPASEPGDDSDLAVPLDAVEPLVWDDCGDGLECSTLTVPRSYAEPDSGNLELDVIRRPAGDPERRIGSLVVNPGGPGGSGVDFVRGGVPLTEELADVFDLVGWDPRGVGATAPDCGESLPEFYAADSAPETESETDRLHELALMVADECAEAAGADLATLSTTATVHDLESLRQGLDEPLSYLGFSYGTELGLLYAERYGDRARALALVGVVDTALGFEGFLTDQTVAADAAAERLLESCDESEGCGLDDAVGAYDDLATSVAEGEFESAGLGPAELVDATIGALYDEAAWPDYLEALEGATEGNPEPLLKETDDYFGDGDLYLGYTAISCLLQDIRRGDSYTEFADELETLSPRFGAAIANELLPCAYWRRPPTDEPVAVTAPGAPRILLAASTGDPATPLEWATTVASRLSDPSMIVWEGEGHSTLLRSQCVSDAVALYLTQPTGPAQRLECET